MSSKLLTNELLLTLKTFSCYEYSPEKKKILYLVSQPDLKENKSFKELYVMNEDGTEPKKISEQGQAIDGPTFILNGEKIAYIQKQESGWDCTICPKYIAEGFYLMYIDSIEEAEWQMTLYIYDRCNEIANELHKLRDHLPSIHELAEKAGVTKTEW